MSKTNWNEIERTIQEIVEHQKEKVLACGRRIVPSLTAEDVLQPNDYQELENHPHFRYEEGMLAGLQTAQMALWALRKEEVS
jgi:hypothetical protein